MQIIRQPKIYDVCIVGSGAGGGMAAKVLCEAGADVVMLEAGPMWDAATDSKMSAWSYDSPRRGAATPSKPFGEFDGCLGGWDIDGEPYTQAAGSTFDWFRGRMLGGRTNHWGRISLRMGPDDFRRKSLDGLGDDWPITYDDIKPYYDRLDRLVGIFGSMENLANEPDGGFLAPPKPRCYQLLIKAAAGARHRQAAHRHRRDGARGPHRRTRPRDRRVVREQGRSTRLRGARADRRARGERLRDGAAAAELDVRPFPRRSRQFERRRWTLSHRFDRPRRHRPHPVNGARRPPQRGRGQRCASLHAVVAR